MWIFYLVALFSYLNSVSPMGIPPVVIVPPVAPPPLCAPDEQQRTLAADWLVSMDQNSENVGQLLEGASGLLLGGTGKISIRLPGEPSTTSVLFDLVKLCLEVKNGASVFVEMESGSAGEQQDDQGNSYNLGSALSAFRPRPLQANNSWQKVCFYRTPALAIVYITIQERTPGGTSVRNLEMDSCVPL